jgi:hypothetical protein
MPATRLETDLARSEERREDQAADLSDRKAHIAINTKSNLLPVWE